MKLSRSVVAAALVVVLAVTGTTQSVQAAPTDVTPAAPTDVAPMAVDPYGVLVDIGISLLGGVFSGGGVSEADLARAVAQITAQIEQLRTDIINHVDAIASAEVQACVRANTIEFASINTMPRTVLQLWAQSATACASLATAYLNALASPAAVDNIGWLVGGIFAIVIAARTKAGLTEGLDLVRQDEISAFNAVRNKLTPSDVTEFGPPPRCVTYWQYADPGGFSEYLHYSCWAYNGDHAEGVQAYWATRPVEPLLDYEAVRVQATQRTSRPVAISALATLQNIHP